jgi:hypothetical protein
VVVVQSVRRQEKREGISGGTISNNTLRALIVSRLDSECTSFT